MLRAKFIKRSGKSSGKWSGERSSFSIGVALLFCCVVLVAGCTTSPTVIVESANQNSRINYLVIHATSENFAESLRLLTQRTANPVSSHYLVPEVNDPTYPDDVLRVYSLVPEQRRAWHAGVSYWAGEEALNNRSIGIEVVNEFKCTGTDVRLSEIKLADVDCVFPDYSDAQIELLIGLIKDVLARNPDINPIDVVAHSDIAIMRKSDPGPKFPWRRLYEEGIGVWPDDETVARYRERFRHLSASAAQLQYALSALGYQVEITGAWDQQTRFAVRAFQLRFRPSGYSGFVDVETSAILWALLEKYRPWALAREPRYLSQNTSQNTNPITNQNR
jgi:N-acetylmuramoyl-L-alanine amidase